MSNLEFLNDCFTLGAAISPQQDPKAAFKAEWEALQMYQHQFALWSPLSIVTHQSAFNVRISSSFISSFAIDFDAIVISFVSFAACDQPLWESSFISLVLLFIYRDFLLIYEGLVQNLPLLLL